MSTGRDKIRSIQKESKKVKKDMFIRWKMWLSFLVSLTTRDRGTIPENIGNNILIMNNMYVTKKFLTVMIHIVELSLDTPITFLAEMIINELRKDNCTAVIDFTIKNNRKIIDLNNYGLKSRIDMWEKSGDNRYLLEKDKRRAVRLLYTVKQVKEGKLLMDSRIFLYIRTKDGTELAKAEKIVYKYLVKIGCIYKPINTSLSEYLEYASLLSNHKSKNIKAMSSIINSVKTLSQMLPNSHSIGDKEGVHMGTNIINNTPFRIDFKKISVGRNIYLVTNTGGGKTALALNMCASALEEMYNLCVMDIKGNEFTNIVDSVGGITISLREMSNEYINTFKMVKEDCTDDNAEIYFKNRFNFSKKQMLILSGTTNSNDLIELEGFYDKFLNHLYLAIGIRYDNRNTWYLSEILNPFKVYDYLIDFINAPIREEYKNVITYVTTNLKMFFSRNGSKSYIFGKELEYKDILNKRAIRFDFGMFAGSSYDATVFRLKFEYMSKINSEYVSNNFDKGIHTFKILEESQAVSNDIIDMYAKEYTLRRAQMQTTILIGNSANALLSNPKATPIIETTTALLIGKLNKSTADIVIEKFDIESKEGIIRYMSNNNKYLRHFLFINNMESRTLSPILKVQYDPGVSYKLLTPTKNII